MNRAGVLPAVALLATLASCNGGRPATDADCSALLDRLVEIEAHERGFQDPALVDRWRAGARAKYAAELASCRGRRLQPSALGCAAKATTAEEVARRCLR
jgi:hypothetical protein